MKKFLTITGIILAMCLHGFGDTTNDVLITLNWVGRSTESSSNVVYGSSLGTEVSAALALPLNPSQIIFDDGTYLSRSGVPAGNQWASWQQYGLPFESYEGRHFRATFTLSAGLQNAVGFSLYSPYYTQYGNIIPINDNAYFYLNGTFLGARGVDYGGNNSLGIAETDGWSGNGNFGSSPVPFLVPGLNTIDIVAEERSLGGGMGLLDLELLESIPEPSTVSLVVGAMAALLCLRRRTI